MIQVLRSARHAVAIAVVCLAMAAPASARHEKEPQGAAEAVAHKLSSIGFQSWRELKWRRDYWLVNEARRANGNSYDLKLEADTLDIIKLERRGH